MRAPRALLALIPLLAFFSVVAAADQASAYVEYQRQTLRGEREATVRANLDLTPEEAKAFWPLYQEYQAERARHGDRLYGMIREYADAYNASRVTDEQAKGWVREALELDQARVKLKERYMDRFSRILPGRKFARYYQIETRLDNLINARLSAEIPLVE
ncbi:MAG TPA: hypothetical protein VFP70_01015 [Burkholderiales bacterium]|nr:hypothetical protein [Burkholderiales bacterium]